ncbi:carboxymuconolactone decarboxylase family protein [Streptomyces sp. NPDC050433]|uniref:carboxymuconolactone decarboxylase family protein n=1 Tax=Streptomyces sp. NPDC050433 TaxID=3365615 RepID=UPI00379FC869
MKVGFIGLGAMGTGMALNRRKAGCDPVVHDLRRDGVKPLEQPSIGMLTVLNRPAQLSHHIEGALNNGCTVDDLKEVLLQTDVHCGLPAAGETFRVAEEVLRTRGLLD